MNKEYNRISVSPLFEIESIIYIVNSQRASGTTEHPGKYNFWQLYYVSEGEVRISRDGEIVTVKAGEAYLFYPHGDLRCTKKAVEKDGVFFVISFESKSPSLNPMSDRIIKIGKSDALAIEDICKTGRKILEPIKHNEEKQGLREKSSSHPAVLQYMKVSLEQFFLKIYCREEDIKSMGDKDEKVNRHNYEKEIVRRADELMRENVCEKLTIDQIAEALAVNKTTLRISYKKETGLSIMRAFSRMKVAEAQRLIAETDMNFTQIGETLGFLSLYHFSRFFKEHTGVTLSEYSKETAKK